MSTETLTRLRSILTERKLTLKQVSDITGISISTLHDMRSERWASRTLDNLQKIEASWPELEQALTSKQGAAA